MDKWEEMELKAISGDVYERAESAEFWHGEFSKLLKAQSGNVSAGNRDENKSRAIIKRFSDIPPGKPEWLWEGHIPRGMFVIIGGDPGQGKSAVSLDIASRISTGSPFIHSSLAKGENE